MSIRALSVVLLLLGALHGAAQAQTIWTVDDSGGADFLDLQPAVNTASDGDVIRIADGVYPDVTIDGKGLTLVAEDLATVQIDGALQIKNLSSNQRASVYGVEVVHSIFSSSPFAGYKPQNLVQNCAGVVLFEDCYLLGGTNHDPASNRFTEGLVVEDSFAVFLARCTLRGDRWPESHGLVARNSSVAVYDSLVTSLPTAPGIGNLGRGANGANVTDGNLYFSGVEIRGSRGSDGVDPSLGHANGGDGGHGVGGGDCVFSFLDSTVFVGQAGLGFQGGTDGGIGIPYLFAGGGSTSFGLDGDARSLESARLLPLGLPLWLIYQGQPDDLVFFATGLGLGANYLPTLRGVIGLTSLNAIITGGPVDGGGFLNASIPVAGLNVGTTVFSQALTVRSSGRGFVTNPTLSVITF